MYTPDIIRVSTKIDMVTPTIVRNSSKMALVASKKDETTPVYDLIQARQDELGKSVRGLAERLGEDHTTIAKQKLPGVDPLLSTIIRMAKVANVSPTVMFEAYLGKRPDPLKLRSKKFADALAEFENLPHDKQERLALMLEVTIREIHKAAEDK